ncbi:MAG: DUF4394 domain-containing protein [Gemmataceae bacterium]|nr:DUF4394 domain-containing protein [Gemmata sp.]MDW8197801.1 DUF4394 domain-containing protein [Gemmataceae bacterium]
MRASVPAPSSRVAFQCETLEDRSVPATGFALSGNTLLAFDVANPSAATPIPITGLNANETLAGIDFHPATQQLLGLGVNAAANTATLYSLAPESGVATPVGVPGRIAFVDAMGGAVDFPDPGSIGYSIRFDPQNGELRIVTESGLAFRVQPTTGAPIDGNLGMPMNVNGINPDSLVNQPAMVSPYVGAMAYATTGTTPVLYTLDATRDALVLQSPSNASVPMAVTPLTVESIPLNFNRADGFAIPSTANLGIGFAALQVNGIPQFYQVDLQNGAATLRGTLPQPVQGLAISPTAASTIQFARAEFTAAEGDGHAAITLVRGGNASYPALVVVNVVGGTATEGTDFIGSAHTVSFAPGQTTATLHIPLVADPANEAAKTVQLRLSQPSLGSVIGAQATATLTILDSAPNAPPVVPTQPLGHVFGSGFGDGRVHVLNADGSVRFSFYPYGNQMLGGVRVAVGDVNGDGHPDIITAPALGAPHVKVFDGRTGTEIRSFYAFDPSFLGGVTVAAGDLDRDGAADIVVGSAFGAAHVKAFSGASGAELLSFYAYSGFAGGVTVATGDVNGDGVVDIVTGTATGPAHLKAFSGANLAVLHSTIVHRPYAGGLNVATGDVNGDGVADLITGTARGASHVKVYSGATGEVLHSFTTFPLIYRGGVSVAARDVNGDGVADILVSALGGTSDTRVFHGVTGSPLLGFYAFERSYPLGVFVA